MAFHKSVRLKVLLPFLIIVLISSSFLLACSPKLSQLREGTKESITLHKEFGILHHQLEEIEHLEAELELYILLQNEDHRKLVNETLTHIRKDVETFSLDRFDGEDLETIQKAILQVETQSYQLIEAVEKGNSSYQQNMNTLEAYSAIEALEENIHHLIGKKEVVFMNNIQEQDTIVSSLSRDFILLEAIIIIIGLSLSLYLSKRITDPLKRLNHGAEKIGKGNLRTRITIQSQDEIGSLARSFNLMAHNLQTYQKKLLKEEKDRGKDLEKEVTKKTKALRSNVDELEKARTAMINMMEDMDKANKELKAVDKAKSEFLNIVSHELKTPLTAIIAYLDILVDSRKNPTKDELKSLDAIRRNSKSLNRLIGNILEIARMESGKFELIYQETDIKKLIEETLLDIQSISDQKGLTLKSDIKQIEPILIDSQRIGEVITNLVSNAIKFTEKGGITIQARKEKDKVHFEIKDTGVGIPKKHIKDLFNKFYQVDASISRKYGGTGLGLAITKKIIEAHGGKITVSSTEGKGTTFSFYIKVNTKKEKE